MSLESLLISLKDAINNHDLEAFVDCFATDYDSKQPVHPDRAFIGKEQVRKNWSANFNEMPDFTAELLLYTISQNTIWAEWEWHGTRKDESMLRMRGVTLFGIKENKIKWGRLYMEPVEIQGAGIEAAVKEVMLGKSADATR